MTELSATLELLSNNLCSDVPTELQALSSDFTGEWKVTTATSIGTVCAWQSYMNDLNAALGLEGSTGDSIIFEGAAIDGTIPSQVCGPVALSRPCPVTLFSTLLTNASYSSPPSPATHLVHDLRWS